MKTILRMSLLLALLLLPAVTAKANPYASGITNIGTAGGGAPNGQIQFIVNENGGTISVVYEDGTTNATFNGVGAMNKGTYTFDLASHTSFTISVTKIGSGVPSLISVDTDQFCNGWTAVRGLDVNKNPKLGYLFGRTYLGNGVSVAARQNTGFYALNADLTDSPLGTGTVGKGGGTGSTGGLFGGSGGSGPWHLRLTADGSMLVDDFSTANAGIWMYSPDLSSSNLILGPIGQVQGANAGVHGDMIGTPQITGSIANGNMVLWVADGGMAVPFATALNGTLGPSTFYGDFNELYRYDIGAGPLPWSHPPDYAYTLGIPSVSELTCDNDLGSDGKIYGLFGRANLVGANIQVLDPHGSQLLYQSLHDGADLFNGQKGAGVVNGSYGSIRLSPDSLYIAIADRNNGITVASITNGIPDESSIFGIQNAPSTSRTRGMCWDAADNILICSDGQFLLRAYSLGLPSTAVTTNDMTGLNGDFKLVLPSTFAIVSVPTNLASQNYVNNGVIGKPNPGTPIPGAINITLNTATLTAPVTVNFAMGGTASLVGGASNYTMNVGTDTNGIVVATNSVTFPVGTFSGGGFWNKNILITPTALPLVGPTLTVTLNTKGGNNYIAASPISGTVFIANTGPQTLTISAANVATGVQMNRAIHADSAAFIITRTGDTNGPDNDSTLVIPRTYTVTNFIFAGTAPQAVNPTDYTAAPQRKSAPSTEVPFDSLLGSIAINPGDVAITNIVGNPVKHTNIVQTPTNLNLTIALATGTATNLTSSEGRSYIAGTGTITVTEIDNTSLAENVLLYTNSLNDPTDSTNWTLTFASTNLGVHTVLPVVITNYANTPPDPFDSAGSNDFAVTFGNPVANDGVPQSDVMAANGWTNALRMTVNKDNSWPAPAGVNVYPQGKNFHGNYALRFQMYLSLNGIAIGNAAPGTLPVEFAEFGINHRGTNCNWKPSTPVTTGGGGSGTTNIDGAWCVVDASANSITPADYDAFVGNTLPNGGITGGTSLTPSEPVSNTAASQAGVFKHPPFQAANTSFQKNGGSPVNQWVDVDLEIVKQTNVNLFIDRTAVISSFNDAIGGITTWSNGTVMLGYLDPVKDVSDNGGFAYFSNVRVVEISPYIDAQPAPNGKLALVGSNVTFTCVGDYGSIPLTNQWVKGTSLTVASPGAVVQTDVSNFTKFTSTLILNNVTTANGTNYYAIWKDAAGSVTSLVAALEVIPNPANVTANIGANPTLTILPVGPIAPNAFQWQHPPGTALANTAGHWGGVTTATLTVTNFAAADVGSYVVVVTDTGITGSPSVTTLAATLTIAGPANVKVVPAAQTNLWGSTANFIVTNNNNIPANFAYQWRKNGTPLADGGNVSGSTTTNLTLATLGFTDAASYTAVVTNSVGSATSTAGVLTILTPQPKFSTNGVSEIAISGGNVTMNFNTTNTFDSTGAWTLQSSPTVDGPYTNTTATFNLISGTNFSVTVPTNGDNVFYRLHHN